ncbi:MAG: Asp-tRNA(Asn)/Glu-tRNA(Gln) amidotransferase subunit GatA [Clostridiales bacterium]|nr:Asp-tRNA(Asn)/Glu-tRNA(Gln) amidotransferase subunit GatA [Clostridiales bacterium]
MNVLDFNTAELIGALKSKKISSVEATKACLDRISNKKELNNFITVFEESALTAAKRADELRYTQKEVSPLLGVPIAVKDNIGVEGAKTTCASNAMKDYVSDDAQSVVKLKQAGAVIVGKTNMDEFAMGSTNETSAFGAVKNVLDNTRTAGGSSGGSANGVAARQAFGALGSDTGGSTRQPAAYCGVVGLKPTFSSISCDGLIGFSPSLDSVGVLSTDCDGALYLFDAIKCVKARALDILDGDVRGKRIGVAQEFTSTDMLDVQVKAAYENALAALKSAGATVVGVSVKSFAASLSAYHVISSAEAANTYRSMREAKLISQAQAELLGAEFKRRMITGTYAVTSENYERLYLKASKVRAVIKAEYESALDMCDVLLCPTAPNTAPLLGENTPPHIKHANDMYTAPVSLAGLPAVSVPFGTANGMPVGIQIIGRRFCEAEILSVGKALQIIG